MSSIPLPALSVRPPEQQNTLGNLAQLLQARQSIQEAPIRQQLLQQQAQAGALQNQQQQYQINQTQALNKGYLDAIGADGKIDPEKLQNSLAQAGHGAAIPDVMKHYNDFATSQVKLQQDQQNLMAAQQDSLGSLGASMKAAKYDPNLALTFIQDRINQPSTPAQQKQQLQAFQQKIQGTAPEMAQGMIQQIADNWIAQSPKQRELAAQELQAQARMKQAGKTPEGEMALNDQQVGQLNDLLAQRYQVMNPGKQPPTSMQLSPGATQKDFDRIDKVMEGTERAQGTMAQNNTANALRAAAMQSLAQSREYAVIDSRNGSLQYLSAADLNAANRAEPGRYVPEAGGAKAMGKTALIEDIRGNISSVRDALKDQRMPEFTADQRAEIAIALGKPEAQGALSAAFRGGVLGSLTSEQQDYLIKMAQLKENAMAMRSVLGAGQGSEDMRAAITATIPGPRTPSKDFALKQLDQFEAVLNRLERGVPNVPLRPVQSTQPQPVQASQLLKAVPLNGKYVIDVPPGMDPKYPTGKRLTVDDQDTANSILKHLNPKQ